MFRSFDCKLCGLRVTATGRGARLRIFCCRSACCEMRRWRMAVARVKIWRKNNPDKSKALRRAEAMAIKSDPVRLLKSREYSRNRLAKLWMDSPAYRAARSAYYVANRDRIRENARLRRKKAKALQLTAVIDKMKGLICANISKNCKSKTSRHVGRRAKKAP